ncbi:ABC transporter substrate-binding protein [Eubacterium sp.]|uniref:ABC transporter substrate-binding protein n=1 Tax=Eubacterium sp. TaxID=142586 RepID=UPI002FC93185
MKKRVISLAMVVMLCLSVFALSGCGGGSSSSEDVIKIGTLGPYTGDTASYGNAAKNGIELAVDQINEAGGVLGKKIELVSYDTKGDATEAVNAYNRLRDNDGVVAIVGPVLSGEALAIKDLAKEDNMPILSPTATADDVTVGADNSFRVCYLDAYQGNAGANYAVDVLGAKNAAILVCKGNAYSEGLASAFTKTFESKGGKILGTESYSDKDNDYSAQLTKIKQLNPEVVYVPDYYSTVGPILQKAKEMGITATFVGGDGWDSVQEEYAEAAEGQYFANHYAADSPKESVQKFITAYKDKYSKAANSFAALGYDAMDCMAKAIENAGSTDKEAVIKALKEMTYDGVTGKFSFDENGNPKGKEITIIKIENGQLKYVTTVTGD